MVGAALGPLPTRTPSYFFFVFRDSVAFSTPIDVTVLMRWNLLKFAGQKNSSASLES